MSEADAPRSDTEAAWVKQEHDKVMTHLAKHLEHHALCSEWPAFHVEPYFAIWPVASIRIPHAVAFWAFSGDIGTDLIERNRHDDADNARKALIRILSKWVAYLPYLVLGENPPGVSHQRSKQELLALVEPLRGRIETLSNWAEDDGLWGEDCPLDT
jgi:hypothetical protein